MAVASSRHNDPQHEAMEVHLPDEVSLDTDGRPFSTFVERHTVEPSQNPAKAV
jgi:hypothetical protein